MPSTNKAAVLTAKGSPLQVRKVDYPSPGKNELVIKVAAVAINPYDWIVQDASSMVVPWIKLPFAIGTDVAGEVTEVGEGVTRFKKGDRVVAYALGLAKEVNKTSEGAFQEYTVLRSDMTSSIPDDLSYESASVLPLGISTAACALFQKEYLALPHPSIAPKSTGNTVLVWSGASSVSSNAIQLAIAAGCEVITTASPKNHAYVKSLGASQVFDYNSKTVVPDIIAAFKGKTSAGAVSIGPGSFAKCVDILGSVNGKKIVAQATFDLPPFPKSSLGMMPFLFAFAKVTIQGKIQTSRKGVTAKVINGSDLAQNEVGPAVFRDFLPIALSQKRYKPLPEAQIAGKGLESVQEAISLQRKGVSARKLVVTL